MIAIFVFAHPDDESMATGGTIAKLVKKGVTVKLITATKGEAGMTGGICKKVELGKTREKELGHAAKILGISKIYFIDFIDGTLHTFPTKKITDKIFKIIDLEKPDLVFTFNKEGGSKHPDHIAISKATTRAFQQFVIKNKKHIKLYHTAMQRSFLKKLEIEGIKYDAFGEIKGTPDFQITTRVNITDVLDKKIKAIKSHKTQKKDWEKFLKRAKHKEFNYENFQLIQESNLID